MGAFIEIVIEGVKKFGGEIVAGVLLAVALWIFPSLRKIFRMKDDSSVEVKEELERHFNIMKQEEKKLTNHERVLQHNDDALRQTVKAQKDNDLEDAASQYSLGITYGNVKDYLKAVDCFRKAAEQGYAQAQYAMGYMYKRGLGVEQNLTKAIKWYRKAAEQGNATAQCNLGMMYDTGYGVMQDWSEAFKWFSKSAEQGNERAQCGIGLMYFDVHIGDADYSEAAKWFRKSAEKGYSVAQHYLGWMYELGIGVPKNFQEARKWYQLAAKQGFDPAKYNLERLNAK